MRQTKEQSSGARPKATVAIAVVYVALTLPFFFRGHLGLPNWAARSIIALPIWFLSVATLVRPNRCSALITIALLFSGAGDIMGGFHNFFGQIGFFAVAQLLYAIYFFSTCAADRSFARLDRIGRTTLRTAVVLYCAYMCIRLWHTLDSTTISIAVTAYIILIGTMVIGASKQGGIKAPLFIVGAVLFLFSDSVIAWNRFLMPVPHSQMWIMTTYYAAQLAIGLTAIAAIKGTRTPKRAQ